MSGSMAISTFVDILCFFELCDLGAGRGSGRRREGYGYDKALSYNFGQNKWKTYKPPPPTIKDGKMARFCTSRGFILDLGGLGLGFAVQFYSVQDCK